MGTAAREGVQGSQVLCRNVSERCSTWSMLPLSQYRHDAERSSRVLTSAQRYHSLRAAIAISLFTMAACRLKSMGRDTQLTDLCRVGGLAHSLNEQGAGPVLSALRPDWHYGLGMSQPLRARRRLAAPSLVHEASEHDSRVHSRVVLRI